MVVHAVRRILDAGIVDRVVVFDTCSRAERVLEACAGLPVSVRDELAPVPSAHVDQRCGTRTGDGSTRIGDILVVHDAARPFAPAELAAAVVDAVRSGHAAAVPVLPLTDTVKQVDDGSIVLASPDRSRLRVVQTPQAVRRDLIHEVPAAALLGAVPALAARGVAVHAVDGHPMAFAVRTAWDLELAEFRSGSGSGHERGRDMRGAEV